VLSGATHHYRYHHLRSSRTQRQSFGIQLDDSLTLPANGNKKPSRTLVSLWRKFCCRECLGIESEVSFQRRLVRAFLADVQRGDRSVAEAGCVRNLTVEEHAWYVADLQTTVKKLRRSLKQASERNAKLRDAGRRLVLLERGNPNVSFRACPRVLLCPSPFVLLMSRN
jgi:hypothetical protein